MNFLYRILLASCMLLISSAGIAQFEASAIESQLKIAQFVLQVQPSESDFKEFLPAGCTVDSVIDNATYFKEPTGTRMIAYRNIETRQVVHLECYQPLDVQKELYSYLQDTKGYTYWGSQHMWDFMNTELLSVAGCVGLNNAVTLHISLYGK